MTAFFGHLTTFKQLKLFVHVMYRRELKTVGAPAVVTHAFNLCTQKADAGGLL